MIEIFGSEISDIWLRNMIEIFGSEISDIWVSSDAGEKVNIQISSQPFAKQSEGNTNQGFLDIFINILNIQRMSSLYQNLKKY